ncbi:exocyst complex component sec5 domain-containing protein [Ditylenchus destructor]|nr:exocyst complex component sec5 domain-containing protein [Ditylenchus destructor]
MSRSRAVPIVTGISPHQGVPGTQVTLRGENLGLDQNDLVALIICGTDCLVSAKWKSSSKIVARLGQAKRGLGDIVVITRSGGRGNANVQFRVFIEEVGPLQESSVWVDESRTVPGRNVVRNIVETTESEDALGLKVDPQRKLDHSVLSKMFPESSGNLRMESFNPAWYLLENHKFTSLSDLRHGFKSLQMSITKEEETSKNIHKANLNSLISCVDALSSLNGKISETAKQGKKSWPVTGTLAAKIAESKTTADKLFKDVLSRKDKADATRNALSILTRFRFIFYLSGSIDDNMAKGEYATILNDYTRAKSLFKDSEVGLFREVMTVLDKKIDALKETLRQKLMDIPPTFEEQSKLIKYLKILDPNSDPAWDCITAYHIWLEDILWQMQNKYYALVLEEESQQNEGHMASLPLSENSPGGSYRHSFITELFAVLTEKLQSFWKLSHSYSNSSDEKFQEKQSDIDQMLTNTINVSSWILLNALVPTSLPESVTQQYKDQFVSWPKIDNPTAHMNYLFFSLRSLRGTIRSLLEFQFNRSHVQPLVELCTTIRLKCLGLVVERASEAIRLLNSRENWKMDMVSNESKKTALPDLYETEINEILPNVKQILSFNNFPGEVDLFSRERVRQMILDLFVVVMLSFKDCYDQILQLKSASGTTEQSQHTMQKQRPNRLVMSDASSLSSAGGTDIGSIEGKPRGGQEVTSRKLLISICNIEYVINHLLSVICRRFTDCGVKFAELIFKKSKQKLIHFRHSLIKHYIAVKTATIVAVIDTASYDQLPDEEDVSDFIKELIMCVVFIQAELYLIAPQLTNQVLSVAIETCLEGVVKLISSVDLSQQENATQVVIDLTALEEAFQKFLSSKMRAALNSIRARLMNKLDRESFQLSMHNFRQALRMATEALQTVDEENPGDNDSTTTDI